MDAKNGSPFHAPDEIPADAVGPLVSAIFGAAIPSPAACLIWAGPFVAGEPTVRAAPYGELRVRSVLRAIDDGGPLREGWAPTCGRARCVALAHRPATDHGGA